IGGLSRFPPDARKQVEMVSPMALLGVFEGQETIIFRTHASAFILDARAALEHPGLPQRRQSHAHVTFDFRIAPRALCIVYAERRIVVQRDFPEWNPQRAVNCSVGVNACTGGK